MKKEIKEILHGFCKRNIKTNYVRYRKVVLILYYFPQLKKNKERLTTFLDFAENDNFYLNVIMAKNETVASPFQDCLNLNGNLASIMIFLEHFGLWNKK